ncbi:YbaY family lipoprotein [Ruegeria sp. Ofav3-42]|uniref:YbaY family lipoprotein n=1 Tax=Ruegeria sp. Ofav3-42 TaxID=2917759 RepID=UPI001EF589C3|nr:YbaY family lipoprotein [Ruegeria sp. Ofav3-42]MCG7519274.1 YbaY family lipoprotein [Ruegeria sp. Ofav3-42]
MLKTGYTVLTAAAISAVLTGAAAGGTIEGTATYRERIAVPPDATLYVQLQDVSRADAPSVTLSAKRYALTGVPAQFELSYDDALIREGMRYVVRGSIFQGDKLLFTTDTAYPVLTNGSGNTTDLVLVKAQPAGSATLEDTNWMATGLNGAALETEKRPSLSFAKDGAFSGSGGCNRFSGQAEISGNKINFPDNMAATLMACPPPLDDVERQFFKALQGVTAYAFKGDTLVLLDSAGQPVVQLARQQ